MSRHLYNARLGKVGWFIKRFGASEVVYKPLRVVFAPLILPWLPRKSFVFRGKTLPVFLHRYNMTWANERAIEIPIAREYLAQAAGQPILEVGNVLSHYQPVDHEVLDKFERGPGIINADVVGFQPSRRYGLILSISTFEHIGFDDEAESPSGRKILEAILSCRRLLGDQGRLVITVPIGYNPDLDAILGRGELGAACEHYWKRRGRLDWSPCDKAEALACQFRRPFPYANAILVAEFSPAAG